MTEAQRDYGSFRDPAGTVFVTPERVFRTVADCAVEDFKAVRSCGVLAQLVEEGLVIDEKPAKPDVLGPIGRSSQFIVEHPKLSFISYPYEWGFYALRDAAILHLDVHLRCLEHGVTLSDASAYNIQFVGASPLFIDTLSFRPYREGETWAGHKQFCEQFLNPLLLRSLLGIPHNTWFRGSMEGVPVEHLSRMLPLKARFSWNILKHVVLQSALQRSSSKASSSNNIVKTIKLPLETFKNILRGLRKWIAALEPAGFNSTWNDYAVTNSYTAPEERQKAAFVAEFASAVKPSSLWDLGCNTGNYSKVALEAGAEFVIGFDFDEGALENAYLRARTEGLNLLTLHLDATNPSPCLGWAQQERKGLAERANADALLALAFVHHLAIAKNIPLDYVLDWLVGLAPLGVIEFVPKNDPMVQELLRLREDIFPNYNVQDFESGLLSRARIVKKEQVSSTGRVLYWYDRT